MELRTPLNYPNCLQLVKEKEHPSIKVFKCSPSLPKIPLKKLFHTLLYFPGFC